jgi:hypothetical protein
MTVGGVYIVRGILVSKKEARRIGKLKKLEDEDEDEEQFGTFGPSEIRYGLEICGWKHNSPMHDEKFVIGKGYYIDADSDKPSYMNLEELNSIVEKDKKLKSIIKKYDLTCTIQTYSIPDDCNCCT